MEFRPSSGAKCCFKVCGKAATHRIDKADYCCEHFHEGVEMCAFMKFDIVSIVQLKPTLKAEDADRMAVKIEAIAHGKKGT